MITYAIRPATSRDEGRRMTFEWFSKNPYTRQKESNLQARPICVLPCRIPGKGSGEVGRQQRTVFVNMRLPEQKREAMGEGTKKAVVFLNCILKDSVCSGTAAVVFATQ